MCVHMMSSTDRDSPGMSKTIMSTHTWLCNRSPVGHSVAVLDVYDVQCVVDKLLAICNVTQC